MKGALGWLVAIALVIAAPLVLDSSYWRSILIVIALGTAQLFGLALRQNIAARDQTLMTLLATRAPNFALACALLGLMFGLARRRPAADGGATGWPSLDATRALGVLTLCAVWAAAWLAPEPGRNGALAFAWLARPLNLLSL